MLLKRNIVDFFSIKKSAAVNWKKPSMIPLRVPNTPPLTTLYFPIHLVAISLIRKCLFYICTNKTVGMIWTKKLTWPWNPPVHIPHSPFGSDLLEMPLLVHVVAVAGHQRQVGRLRMQRHAPLVHSVQERVRLLVVLPRSVHRPEPAERQLDPLGIGFDAPLPDAELTLGVQPHQLVVSESENRTINLMQNRDRRCVEQTVTKTLFNASHPPI